MGEMRKLHLMEIGGLLLFQKDYRITGTFENSMSLCIRHPASLSTDVFIAVVQYYIEIECFVWNILFLFFFFLFSSFLLCLLFSFSSLSLSFFFSFFESLSVTKATLEFTLYPRLASNLWTCASASE